MQEQVANTVAEQEPAVNTSTQDVKKKRKRGISNETASTNRLKFDSKDAHPSLKLFKASVESITVTEANMSAEKNQTMFAGCVVPRLNINFVSPSSKDYKPRYVSISFLPVESTALTIVGGKEEWKYTSVMAWLKHMLDVFILQGRPMTEEMEDSLILSYDDTDDDGGYVPVPVEEVIAGWKSLFEAFAAMFTNNGTPVYNNTDGTPKICWIKLLRHQKTKKGWVNVSNGDLAFPSFVQTGVIELYKENVKPSISVNPVNESVDYKEGVGEKVDKKPNTPDMGIPSGGMTMGSEMGMGGYEDPIADLPEGPF